jgi:hypothetical protein
MPRAKKHSAEEIIPKLRDAKWEPASGRAAVGLASDGDDRQMALNNRLNGSFAEASSPGDKTKNGQNHLQDGSDRDLLVDADKGKLHQRKQVITQR